MTVTARKAASPPRNAWSFVSGKVSVLEAELLPRSFFETILRSKNLSEARAALGKTVYRSLFTTDESMRDFSAVLSTYLDSHNAEIISLSPKHPMLDAFGMFSRYRTFRTLFNQQSTASNPAAESLEKLFDILTADPEITPLLKEHVAMLYRRDNPQSASAVERSLYLDSAACTLLLIYAEMTSEELVRTYIHDRAVLAAWSAVLRARWNNVPADMLRRWFIFGLDNSLASDICANENNPVASIRLRLSSAATASCLDRQDLSTIKADVDAVVADALRETVWACRNTPCGPEKVLSHLVANEVENINLQLCLASVSQGIDPKVTTERLRREYA